LNAHGKILTILCKKLQEEQEVPEKVSRMAINVPGGFQTEEKMFDFLDEHKIVVLPGFQEVPLEDPKVPMAIRMGAKAILKAESALKRHQLEEMAGSVVFHISTRSKFLTKSSFSHMGRRAVGGVKACCQS
jgi:hypothetical protein